MPYILTYIPRFSLALALAHSLALALTLALAVILAAALLGGKCEHAMKHRPRKGAAPLEGLEVFYATAVAKIKNKNSYQNIPFLP